MPARPCDYYDGVAGRRFLLYLCRVKLLTNIVIVVPPQTPFLGADVFLSLFCCPDCGQMGDWKKEMDDEENQGGRTATDLLAGGRLGRGHAGSRQRSPSRFNGRAALGRNDGRRERD